ncbi:MAG: ABC transporter permease, partial [Trueperaceae bacterium]|nr:ABC transporter permease [Trueperaceae bacterium]
AQGRSYRPGADEALIAETASSPHGLAPGATLRLRAPRDAVTELDVVGTARQPEHLSMIPERGFMAMPATYLVAYVPPATAERLLGRQAGVTEIAIELAAGADADAVEEAVRALLRRYRVDVVRGGELASVRNVRSHLDTLSGAALVFPLLFLVGGSLGGLILVSRVVHRERGIIGLLRAFGVGKTRLAVHYLVYPLALAAVGAGAGAPLGLPLARFVRRIFAADLGTPIGAELWRWDVALLGVAASLAAGFAAGLVPSLRAAQLAPVVAMRPAAPPVPRGGPRSSAPSRLPSTVAMVVRNLRRRPGRTALTVLGIVFALVLALAPALLLAEMTAVEARVRAVRAYDVRVTPRTLGSMAWVDELRSVPGVARVEPLVELPVVATLGATERRTYVVGLAAGTSLFDLPAPPPGRALLATGLPEADGDVFIRGPLASIDLTIDGRVDYPLGRPIVVSIEDAQRLLTPPAVVGEVIRTLLGFDLPTAPPPVTAALVSFAPEAASGVADVLRNRGDVARVDDRASENADLARIFGLTRAFIGLIEVLAIVLGFALVFNTVTITALERRPELATLRALGFQHAQVARLFRLEALAVSLLAVPLGAPIALAVARIALNDFGAFLPGGVALRAGPLAAALVGLVAVTLAACTPALRDLRRATLADEVRTRA